MEQTILEHPIGWLWMISSVVVAGLVVAGPTGPWNWLLPAVFVGGGAAWYVFGRGAGGQAGSSDSGSTEESAALETLKQQYAVGEIGEAEFERRAETLLETDSATDVPGRTDVERDPANDAVGSGGAPADRESAEPAENTQSDRREGRRGCRRRGKRRRGRR